MTRSITTHLPCFATTPAPRSIHLFLACDVVASYKIALKATVAGEYEAIASKADRRRVLWKIAALTENPRPVEAIKLPERQDQHRISLERHRIIYQIDDIHKQVMVFRIANRRRRNSTG
jgi:mRNA-degrading endonuclease RelE of RelBE toxin-antitoxin system